MAEFASIDELVADDRNVHVECSRETSAALLAAVRARYRTQRCAFVVETDRGFERDSVAAHLRFYGSIARSTCITKTPSRISTCAASRSARWEASHPRRSRS